MTEPVFLYGKWYVEHKSNNNSKHYEGDNASLREGSVRKWFDGYNQDDDSDNGSNEVAYHEHPAFTSITTD